MPRLIGLGLSHCFPELRLLAESGVLERGCRSFVLVVFFGMAYVDNRPLREAFERSGLSASEVARRAGYGHGDRANDAAVKAALGLKRCKVRGKDLRWTIQKRMREDTALRFLEALSLDPVDIGL